MSSAELPEPTAHVVLLFNPHGEVVAIGDEAGIPWAAQENAEAFLSRIHERYPSLQGIALPVQSAAMDLD